MVLVDCEMWSCGNFLQAGHKLLKSFCCWKEFKDEVSVEPKSPAIKMSTPTSQTFEQAVTAVWKFIRGETGQGDTNIWSVFPQCGNVLTLCLLCVCRHLVAVISCISPGQAAGQVQTGWTTSPTHMQTQSWKGLWSFMAQVSSGCSLCTFR